MGLATSGKSFTAGFEIGCKISLNPGWHSARYFVIPGPSYLLLRVVMY
jgi:hypothetical protein